MDNEKVDYLAVLTLIGLSEQKNVELIHTNADFDYLQYGYNDESSITNNKLYGLGFSYSGKIRTDFIYQKSDKEISKNVIIHLYDVVVYGTIHRYKKFLNIVISNYNTNHILLLDGEDISYQDINLKLFLFSLLKSTLKLKIQPPIRMMINKKLFNQHKKHFLIFKRELVNENAYPISFSIPKELVNRDSTFKKREMSTLVPGIKDTYLYKKEEDYYNHYKECYFALTFKKGGWDCLRHYEIIAAGAIPYFPDLANCPIDTMFRFPKQILLETNYMFINNDWVENYWTKQKLLMDWLLRYLTTESMSEYLIGFTGFTD